jgi:hypothetical protein
VRHIRATAATLGISLITDLMQLLPCPRRPGYQAQGEPPSDDRRRHIACCGRLANRGDLLGLAHHTNASDASLLLACVLAKDEDGPVVPVL